MRNPIDYSLRRVSTKDFAYSEIKERIVKGDLPPDEPIIEEHLASELKISRTPLREALQRLEFEELVVRQTNGRLRVAPISIQEVEEIFMVRSKLEGIVVVQAAENATDRDIRHLSNITHMIKETSNSGNIDDILYYGAQFHTYLYELSGNKTVVKILYQLNDHIHRYRRLVPIRNVDRNKNAAEEHQLILDCISHKDKERAESAMNGHIQNSLEAAVKSIKEYEQAN